LFAAARGFARWIAACVPRQWLRSEGAQLGGKTLGLVGFAASAPRGAAATASA
jgi:phosphoglycerate dehydrogenase-like enzyme